LRSKGIVACAVLVLGITVQAAQKIEKSASVRQGGGFVVVVDPVTRQIREATPDDIGALSPPPTTQAAPSQPTIFQVPGGGVGATLGPEFRIYAVATKTADGKVRVQEVDGTKAAHSSKSVDGK